MTRRKRIFFATILAILGATSLLDLRSHFARDTAGINGIELIQSHDGDPNARSIALHTCSGILTLERADRLIFRRDDDPPMPTRRSVYWQSTSDMREPIEHSPTGASRRQQFGPVSA